MIRNYFKIAWRNLARSKAFSFINIFGLAVGLATCFLIMLYIFDERSYDKHQKDADRIFRVALTTDKGDTWAAVAAPVAEGLKNNLPEVEAVTRLLTFKDIQNMLIKYEHNKEQKLFYEPNGYYVDSNFFQIFTYDFIAGNSAAVLKQPNSIVLSEETARKFFGNDNAIDKIVIINTPMGEFNYTVTGVFDNGKNKSHIPANYFLSMHNNDMWNWVQNQTGWGGNSLFYTYVKLKAGANQQLFQQKLNPLFNSYAGSEMKAAGYSKSLFIQPVKDIYLRSSLGNEIAPNGNITYLYILGSIAAFILLIACINFMNLSTARSEKRAKEVGVRKVMGAEKKALVQQFLGESLMTCLIALLIALLLAGIFLPFFNNTTQKQLHLFNQPVLIPFIIGLALLTGLLAGLYPAFYLSAFKPIATLKGRLLNNFSAVTIRKGLVVFQFIISIVLMLGAIVTGQQLKLFKNKNLGFNKDQQVVLPLLQAYKNSESSYTPLKNELLQIPGIKKVTCGSTYPGVVNLNSTLFYPEGKTVKDVVDINFSAVENDYIENLGFKILSGRSFSKEFTADSASIILNETAVKKLGYNIAGAVGKKIQYDYDNKQHQLQIVGVVKDFNFESLHNEIKSFAFTTALFASKYNYVIASVNTTGYSGLLQQIEKSWNKLNPSTPFVYSFLDQDFQLNYQKEERTSSIVVYFTLIAILIACLGLFGLAAFSAEQRTKEIGIRKVLGASIADVTSLLSKDYIKLILIAIGIASPVAWYVMDKWLQNFAYRITISWWFFAAATLLAVLIAFVTIGYQSIKAALMNPIKSLKSE
jgi:putative ABC transport system permease protein